MLFRSNDTATTEIYTTHTLSLHDALPISASTVRRWLACDALKPWQHRSWIYPRDPDFAAKAARALDLYAGFFDGEPLGENEFVVCADEKTSIQARYNATATPFDWRFTRTDLDQLLDRIAVHEAAAPIQSTTLTAA